MAKNDIKLSPRKKLSILLAADLDLESVLSMPLEEINQQLQDMGIDPELLVEELKADMHLISVIPEPTISCHIHESALQRKHPRYYVKPSQPVLLVNANGISAQASLRDYSEDGLSLILQNFLHVSKGEQVLLTPMIPSPAAKNIDDRGKIIDDSFLRQYQGSFVVRWIKEAALQSTIGLTKWTPSNKAKI